MLCSDITSLTNCIYDFPINMSTLTKNTFINYKAKGLLLNKWNKAEHQQGIIEKLVLNDLFILAECPIYGRKDVVKET